MTRTNSDVEKNIPLEEQALLTDEDDTNHAYDIQSRDNTEGRATTTGRDKFGSRQTGMPWSVFLILGTETCERFNYYGLRTVLVLYLTEWLDMAYHTATAVYHFFSMLAYFSPIFGAIIADGYIGRYRTILYISLFYALGTIVLASTAFPPPELYGPMIGLTLISLGTGGIKPCVAAFGGDQFAPGQLKEQASFFSAFYFTINLGSAISTFVTPILRADVHCVGDSCFPLAFGVPALLMCVSIAIFVSGRSHYQYVQPTGNVIGKALRCIAFGVCRRLKRGMKRENGDHWLDCAKTKFEAQFVEDVKALLVVAWLFLPIPLAWALFDQQGSRWTLQAVELNGQVGPYRVKPDQLQVLNPVLVLILIPIFDRLVYPWLEKRRLPSRPLQRMCAGMFLVSLSFLLAGLVQLKVESRQDPPLAGQGGVTFYNACPCRLDISSKFYKGQLDSWKMSAYVITAPDEYTVTSHCLDDQNNHSLLHEASISIEGGHSYRILISASSSGLKIRLLRDVRDSNKNGDASVSFVDLSPPQSNSTMVLHPWKEGKADDTRQPISLPMPGANKFVAVEPGLYQVSARQLDSAAPVTMATAQSKLFTLDLGSGSIHTVVIEAGADVPGSKLDQLRLHQFTSKIASQVSMVWMLPQYIVITVGEVLFAVTGLAFAYTQAPNSMKSLVQALWLLTSAAGDFVVVLVAEAQMVDYQSTEFFLFCGLMLLDTGIFTAMAWHFKPSPPREEQEGIQERLMGEEEDEGEGKLSSPTLFNRKKGATAWTQWEKGD